MVGGLRTVTTFLSVAVSINPLLQFVSVVEAGGIGYAAKCGQVRCRAGRECRVLSTGDPNCVCRTKCPPRKHPICGSNGILYENHCELHREACVKGEKIRIMFVNDSCFEDPMAILKRQLEINQEEIELAERKRIKVPRACHQNSRDRTREFLITWFQLVGVNFLDEPEIPDERTALPRHFKKIDELGDGNGFVDAGEWLNYFLKKSKEFRNEPEDHRVRSKWDKINRRQRRLCIEALVEEGDRDKDWKLAKDEFVNLMDPDYRPSVKYCVRDKKRFEDGTRTKVECNGCTCACGKWICTSKLCQSNGKQSPDPGGDRLYDDRDNVAD